MLILLRCLGVGSFNEYNGIESNKLKSLFNFRHIWKKNFFFNWAKRCIRNYKKLLQLCFLAKKNVCLLSEWLRQIEFSLFELMTKPNSILNLNQYFSKSFFVHYLKLLRLSMSMSIFLFKVFISTNQLYLNLGKFTTF